jgi:Lhr-like helicase
MAREQYSLSDETFQVLINHESKIAEEYGCHESYIFAIKNQKSPDPFPKFRRMFRAAARSGAKAEIWFHVLAGDLTRARRADVCTSELSAKLLEKITAGAEAVRVMVDASSDGYIDERECHAILAALSKLTGIIERLREIVLHRLGEIKEKEGK